MVVVHTLGTLTPKAGTVHPIAKVMAWLERHPRWTFHFTPTSAPGGPSRCRPS
jgi:hypothetical protein